MTLSVTEHLHSQLIRFIPYGEAVTVRTPLGRLTVDTSALPVDPERT
ncbi:hypothetical protein [Streptomyces sp. NBC_00859]|nr:hypothetical protein OG584_14140 [Streptomyces sp. NBC_00859]